MSVANWKVLDKKPSPPMKPEMAEAVSFFESLDLDKPVQVPADEAKLAKKAAKHFAQSEAGATVNLCCQRQSDGSLVFWKEAAPPAETAAAQ